MAFGVVTRLMWGLYGAALATEMFVDKAYLGPSLQHYNVISDTISLQNVTGYEKRDHFAHFPNFHFKTLISLEP